MKPDILVQPTFEEISARDESIKRFLFGILAACDLPKDLHDRAVAHYKEKTEHLKSCPVLQNCEVVMKLQGSQALGTTTPPPSKKSGEFDVDILLAIEARCTSFKPFELHREIGSHLKLEYKKDLSPIKLGWTIDRAFEERLHFDIVPAVRSHHQTQGPILSATSWADRSWKATNPEGYAAGFLALAQLEPQILSDSVATANESRTVFANRRYEPKVEPMPQHSSNKRLLQRVVQLAKRHRDLWFLKLPENGLARRPPSIVITTLMWYAYERYVANRTFDTLTEVLKVMARGLTDSSFLRYEQNKEGSSYCLWNPSLPEENLVAKWKDPANARSLGEYFAWTKDFQLFVEKLSDLEFRGRHLFNDHFSAALGEEYVRPVFDHLTQSAAPGSPQRAEFGYKSGLGIVTGISSALALPPHTNHGVE